MQVPMDDRLGQPDAGALRPRSATRDLMLVRLGLDDSELEVDLSETSQDSGDGCGGGFWCPVCRAEIQAEAFAWLHELSESYPML
jgi:hypothetical protein